MRQISSMILLAAAVVVANGTHVGAQEEPLRDVISAQWEKYKEGLKEYQFRYTNSHYNFLPDDIARGAPSESHTTVSQIHRGASSVYIRESTRAGGNSCSVVAINSQYAFWLEKGTPSAQWRVRVINRDLSHDIQLKGVGKVDLYEDFSYRYSPYKLGLVDFLPELLKRPGFSVTKTESVGPPEEGFSKIWFKAVADEISDKQKGTVPIEGTGWLILDPKCYWCVRECELPYYSPRFPKSRAVARYQYDVAHGSFPLLKQIEIVYYAPETSEKPTSRTVLDYVLEKRVPAEKEFTLSAFGFPEPTGVVWHRPTPWYLYFIGAGVGLLALGVYLRRRLNRRKSPSPDNERQMA